MKDDRPYLEHILECINWITEYTHEGKKFFLTDKKTQDAVLRNLQTLAGSARRLSALEGSALGGGLVRLRLSGTLWFTITLALTLSRSGKLLSMTCPTSSRRLKEWFGT